MTSLSRRKFFSALASLGAAAIAPRIIKIQTASMYGMVQATKHLSNKQAWEAFHGGVKKNSHGYVLTTDGISYYGAGSAAMAILRADFAVYDYRSAYPIDIKSTR